jgi:hypothetical protein
MPSQVQQISLAHEYVTLQFQHDFSSDMAITEADKWAIISTFKATQNLAATARRLNINTKSVAKWVRRHQETGGVAKVKGTGRRALLSEAAAKEAVKLLLDGNHGGASHVGRVLQSKGLVSKVPHRTTVTRAAKKVAKLEGAPIRAVRGMPVKELNPSTRQKRMKFASSNLNKRWDHVMFTDRSKFHFFHPGASIKPVGWVRKGQKREAPRVNHAMVVNLYAGITKWGVTKCHIVAGTSKHNSKYLNKKGQSSKNIRAAEYRDVLKETLLPEGTRIFGTQGVSTWFLQQNNDPTHRVAEQVVKDWNIKKGSSIQILPSWPPSSPDLSPIENFWGWVKRKVDEKGCKTFDEFQFTVLAVIKNVPKPILQAYFNSMKARLYQTLALEGAKTSY